MTRIATLAAAAACVALQVSAQTVPLGYLDRVDTNDDGVVTEAEFDTFAATAFQMLDTDSDRSLSPAEVEGHIGDAEFADMDTDGDGMVSRQEFGRRMAANFAAADQDGDGVLE